MHREPSMEKEINAVIAYVEDRAKAEEHTQLDWEIFESVCPICGNTMLLANGFHRCRACGYKESCCYL